MRLIFIRLIIQMLRYIFRILLFIFFSAVPVINSHAQENILNTNISVHIENLPLKDALDTIAQQSGFSFSYSSKRISTKQLVSIKSQEEQLKDDLDRLFSNLNISYTLVEGKIILTKSKNRQKTQFTISGYVRDEMNGETLIGSTILIRELGQGAISNAYGFYSISIPGGKYTIQYSFIGYEDITKHIDLQEDVRIDMALNSSIEQLAEIVISPGDSVLTLDNIRDNVFALRQDIVSNKTAAMGESDVVKSLELVPGVQLFRDGSTFFNVRGGDRDQNQILVDDAPIYNPAHLLGLFSSIIPEATKDIKLYRGDLPAEFGGRISSVLDIKTREGNLNRTNFSGSAGIIAGRLALEGPIKKEKSSYFISARRSYLFELIKSTDSDITSFYFADFAAKANLKLNHRNRLYISTYFGRDEFLADGGITWSNDAATIRWNKVFTDKLFANFTLYSSSYEYQLISSPELKWTNDINNASLKADFTKYVNPDNTLKYGFRISAHSFNPGNVEDANGDIPEDQPFVPKRNATEFSHYVSREHRLWSDFFVMYGLRWSTWSNIGKTIEYTINDAHQVTDTIVYDNRDEYNSFSNLEPRISLTWLASKKSVLKANYARSSQYINLISNSISPFNNLEVWLPASVNIQPQTADQLSVGWFKNLVNWKLGVEAYYKWMYNQIDYANQAKLILNPQMETQLRFGTGRAYGIEFKLERNGSKMKGWISYAYSRSLRNIEEINDGDPYPALWDRPHQLALNGTVDLSDRSILSTTLYISSGTPITSPVGFYEFLGRNVPIYDRRNNDRLPVYHRYDISLKWRLNKTIKKNFNHFLTFSVFNFYGQKNSILNNFNKMEKEDGTYVVPSNLNNSDLVSPTNIYVYNVVPSVTYSFKF